MIYDKPDIMESLYLGYDFNMESFIELCEQLYDYSLSYSAQSLGNIITLYSLNVSKNVSIRILNKIILDLYHVGLFLYNGFIYQHENNSIIYYTPSILGIEFFQKILNVIVTTEFNENILILSTTLKYLDISKIFVKLNKIQTQSYLF